MSGPKNAECPCCGPTEWVRGPVVEETLTLMCHTCTQLATVDAIMKFEEGRMKQPTFDKKFREINEGPENAAAPGERNEMSRPNDAQRDNIALVLECLSPNEPLGERQLLDALAMKGVEHEAAKDAVNVAHGLNMIRWVAFDGWCLGGRPE